MRSFNTKIFRDYTKDEIKEFVNDYYQKQIQGTSIRNKDRGITIEFNKRGRVKTAKVWMSKDKAVVVMNIRNLLATATLSSIGASKEKHKAICFLNFQIVCVIDGKKKRYRVPVMVTPNGKFQYDLHENRF